jgi:protein PhnA
LHPSLLSRSNSRCELCSSDDAELAAFDLKPNADGASSVAICTTCQAALTNPATSANHWHCLRESMWSEHAPVQALVYRTLSQLSSVPWAQDLLSQMYLDDEAQALATLHSTDSTNDDVVIVDSNGTRLLEGDTVTLIKDLDVKGGGFTAKRGTTVKGIRLTDDPKYVEGKVNGIHIVLVAAYLKKA